MRKNNKVNLAFFEETDIGCQEKKKHKIPLNEDDLEQIAKEEYTVGLLKTFISLDKKMSIDDFWGILEPKFKSIKIKPSWLRSEKWEGTLTVSLNKQYYIDLCQYYINAKYDSEFIYFPDEAVKENRKLAKIQINDNYLDPKFMKDNMSSHLCINPFGFLVLAKRNIIFCIKRTCEYFSKLDDYHSYDVSLIRSYMQSVEVNFDRSFAHLDEMILLATIFSRQDIIYEMETRYNEYKRIVANGLAKLSDYIIKNQNMISNLKNTWSYSIQNIKSELEILIKTKTYLQNRINYEKDN